MSCQASDTDGGAYSPSGQSSSYSLTTLSSPSSTDRRAETDRMFVTTQIAVAHHFSCRLRRRESCILGATSSQPTLPLHELLPARLVIHRQTSAHERRKWMLSVQSRSGILAHLCPRQHWLWVTVEPHISGTRHEEAVAREGGRYLPVRRVLGSEPLSLRTHRHRPGKKYSVLTTLLSIAFVVIPIYQHLSTLKLYR